MNADAETQTWPELAIGLYDQLTRRNAEITYEFDDLHVQVPSSTGSESLSAPWRVAGKLRIHTRDRG